MPYMWSIPSSLSCALLRIASTYFWPSGSNASRPSDVCNRFWTYIASESFWKCSLTILLSVRSASPAMPDESYRLYTIMRSLIGFTRSRGTLKCFARFLSRFFLLLFPLVLGAVGCVIARTPGLSQWFDNRLKIPVQHLFSSIIGFQSVMFLADWLARLLDLSRAHQPCSSLTKYQQRLATLRYRVLVKSFSISFVFKRIVLVYH